MVQTGLNEEIKVEEKSGGSENITNKFGVLTSASHTVNQPTDTRASIGQGAQPVATVDDVIEASASVGSQPSNLEVLEIFGSFTDNGDGTYTVEPTDTLETYTIKHQKVEGGGTVTIDGFKFGSFSLSAEQGGDLELEVDGQGKTPSADDSETITTEDPDTNIRRFFDATVSVDGTTVGSVESFTVDHNRSLEAFKGIEDDAAGEKRTPTEIIEKLFDTSFSLVINIENLRAYEEAFDDSTSPYEIQDSRSDVDITITIDTSAGTDDFKLLNTRSDEVSADMSNDADVRTATLSGVARDWQVDGDL